jgi:hypothetical protein
VLSTDDPMREDQDRGQDKVKETVYKIYDCDGDNKCNHYVRGALVSVLLTIILPPLLSLLSLDQ